MSKKFESLHKIYLMVRLFPLILKQSFLKSSTISFNIAVTFFLHILWRTFYKYLLSTHYIPGTLLGTWWACGKAKIPYIHRDYIIFQKMILTPLFFPKHWLTTYHEMTQFWIPSHNESPKLLVFPIRNEFTLFHAWKKPWYPSWLLHTTAL